MRTGGAAQGATWAAGRLVPCARHKLILMTVADSRGSLLGCCWRDRALRQGLSSGAWSGSLWEQPAAAERGARCRPAAFMAVACQLPLLQAASENILLCGYTTFGLFLRQITSSPPTPPYISHFPLYLPLPWSASFHSHPNFDTALSFLRCAFHGL